MALEKKKKITLNEYEMISGEQRFEVFDGALYDMSAPSLEHQRIVKALLKIIDEHIEDNPSCINCEAFVAPTDVLLSDEPLTICEPDLLVVCDPAKTENGKRVIGAPDFIIEVSSEGDFRRDYIDKLGYYTAYGVKEYWIINPQKKVIDVYHLPDEGKDVYGFDDIIPVDICDNFSIDFSRMKFQ